MRRDVRAYLSDIVDSCDAIAAALDGIDLDAYKASRLIRSAVEREFTIIGEAVSVLSRKAPDVFDSIAQSRRVVDFRNQLTHGYATASRRTCCESRPGPVKSEACSSPTLGPRSADLTNNLTDA